MAFFDFFKDERVIIFFVLALTVFVFLFQTKSPQIATESALPYQEMKINTESLNKAFFKSENKYELITLPADIQKGRENPFAPTPTSSAPKASKPSP